jgi:hypothetical protein
VALKFLVAINPMFEIIKDTELDSYAVELANAIVGRMKEKNEKDAKEIDKIGIKAFFKSIKNVMKRSNLVEAKDKLTFTMLEERLNSKLLIRKLQGLDILKQEYAISRIGNSS